MKLKTLVAVVLSLALVATVAEAQSVDDVINKAIKAVGGKDALKSINTMKTTGKITMAAMGMEIPFTGYQKRPNKMRYEMSVQGMDMVQATDGVKAWQSMAGAAQEMTGEQGAAMLRQADFDGAYVDYKAKGIKAALIGKETVEGEELYNVEMAYPDGFKMNLYFDVATGLPRMMKAKVMGFDSVTTISDYRQVGSILAAFSIEQTGIQGQMTIEIEDLKFNEPVDDAIFIMPESN
jgi:outer membrane lipoprotein-sorting protein